jgi:hypothetical protein
MDDKVEWEKIKAAALEYLYSGPDPEARETVKSFLIHLENKINDAAAADRQTDAVVEKLRAASASLPAGGRTVFERVSEAMQSPPFYFVFGGLMLVSAFISTESQFNSSLTFLIAMLGLAIMLYGTGSQAAGTFGAGSTQAATLLKRAARPANGAEGAAPEAPEEPEPASVVKLAGVSAPMNVAIAGGAAVLSAFFGWAVLHSAQDIRQVFRDDDRYTIVKVALCDKSVSTCRDPKITSVQTTEELRKTSLVPQQVMDELSKDAYLETSFGHKAYARKEGRILEFVVFDRDLDDGDDLHIMGTTVYDNTTYSVDATFFDLRKSKPCATEKSNSVTSVDAGQRCQAGVFKLDDDARDTDRVRRLVIRAPVAQEANEFAVQGGTIEDRRPTNPIAPL